MPLGLNHRVRRAQRRQYAHHMLDVAYLDDDVIGVKSALAVRQAQIGDVRHIGGEDARHFGERARFVEDDDAQARIAALAVFLPPKVDPVGIDPVGEPRAIDDMHLDPLAGARQADDPVAGNGMAAIGKLIGDAGGQPRDRHRRALHELAGLALHLGGDAGDEGL